jgi:hypothetical protein
MWSAMLWAALVFVFSAAMLIQLIPVWYQLHDT